VRGIRVPPPASILLRGADLPLPTHSCNSPDDRYWWVKEFRESFCDTADDQPGSSCSKLEQNNLLLACDAVTPAQAPPGPAAKLSHRREENS
jgi:hypothetical protein